MSIFISNLQHGRQDHIVDATEPHPSMEIIPELPSIWNIVKDPLCLQPHIRPYLRIRQPCGYFTWNIHVCYNFTCFESSQKPTHQLWTWNGPLGVVVGSLQSNNLATSVGNDA
jgi:hypothetical protein